MSEKWEFTKHACGNCFGRILTREAGDKTLFVCSECKLEVEGSVTNLCSCRAKLQTGKDAGYVCVYHSDHIVGIGREVGVKHVGDK